MKLFEITNYYFFFKHFLSYSYTFNIAILYDDKYRYNLYFAELIDNRKIFKYYIK